MSDLQPNEDENSRRLQAAREYAATTRKYKSCETRAALIEEFKKRTSKTPYPWQLDVTEALILGLDCIVLAGTGAGKTMPFIMPLFIDASKHVVIVSPLIELQENQQRRFEALGLAAAAVNQDTWSASLRKDILAHKFRVLLAGPEMLLQHMGFSPIIRDPVFMRDTAAIIIDEVHCIPQWRKNFRTQYGDLDRLRSFVSHDIPFLATSATLTPDMVTEIRAGLNFRRDHLIFWNLGNDRPNIAPIVHTMRRATDFAALRLVIDEAFENTPLVRTLIFVSDRMRAARIWEYLVSQLPGREDSPYHSRIDFIHALRSQRAKKLTMQAFEEGRVDILVATDVAGMGTDIPNITRVIEFGLPHSLIDSQQHFGRCGRQGEQSYAIMMVPPSTFQIKKARDKKAKKSARGDEDRNDADDSSSDSSDSQSESDLPAQKEPEQPESRTGDEIKYVKTAEPDLRKYLDAARCRRDITDQVFNNPARNSINSGPCCDLCVTRKSSESPVELTDEETHMLTLIKHLAERRNADGSIATAEKPPKQERAAPGYGARTAARLTQCREGLIEWRRNTLRKIRSLRISCLTEQSLLPDSWLKTLAHGGHIRTVADIKSAVPHWGYVDRFGSEIIQIMNDVDEEWDRSRLAIQAENKRIRAEQSKAKAEQRAIDRRVKREAETLAKRNAKKAKTDVPRIPFGPPAATIFPPLGTVTFSPFHLPGPTAHTSTLPPHFHAMPQQVLYGAPQYLPHGPLQAVHYPASFIPPSLPRSAPPHSAVPFTPGPRPTAVSVSPASLAMHPYIPYSQQAAHLPALPISRPMNVSLFPSSSHAFKNE